MCSAVRSQKYNKIESIYQTIISIQKQISTILEVTYSRAQTSSARLDVYFMTCRKKCVTDKMKEINQILDIEESVIYLSVIFEWYM